MKLDIAALRARAAATWADFNAGQRTMLGIAGLAVVVGGWMVMSWASAPTWTPLYSGLSPEDAVDITTALDSSGIAYKLDHAGTSVLVHQDDLYKTRLQLSAVGVPNGGIEGYSLLDNQGLTTSQFEQRVNYQRAIEGELSRTITAIEGIESTTVHLVMPEDDLFSGDDVMATASVLVKTRGDAALGGSQVQAIVNLVASSVEGLTPTNVTIADTSGRVLSAPGQDGMNFAAGEQRVSQQVAYEAATSRAIESLLAPIAGIGKTRVAVSADLDFDTKQSVSRSYGDRETAPISSEKVTTETYTGNNGNVVGGVLGPDVIPPNAGDGEPNEYSREDANRSYLVDETTQEVISAPGSIRRLSVAVLIDESVGVNTDDIAQLVSASAGLQLDRGDTIKVSAMTFAAVDDVIPAGDGTSTEGSDSIVLVAARSGGIVLLVLLVLLLAYRSAKRSSLAKYPVAIPLPVDDDDDDDAIAALAAIEDIDLDAIAAELPPPAMPEHLVLQNQLGELIDRQPDDVAAVLRTWLADRRN